MNTRRLSGMLLGLAATLTAFHPAASSADEWTGTGASLNWSDLGNWSGGSTPDSSSYLYFSDIFYPTAYTNAIGLVNNIVDSSFTAGGLNFNTLSGSAVGNHHYTTLIPTGVTLTIDGSAGGPGGEPTFMVGNYDQSSGSLTNYTTITGEGQLALNNPASTFNVRQVSRATLDLSGLNTFSANAANFWIGVAQYDSTATFVGNALLAKTNIINTAAGLNAPGILLGSANIGTGTATLGLGRVNTFNTDAFTIGGLRAGFGTMLAFAPGSSNSVPTATFTLRGSAGGTTPAALLTIGDLSANFDGFATTRAGSASASTADFSGGVVDIKADAIYIGRSANPEVAVSSGSSAGTLIVEQGTVSANNVYLAHKVTATNSTAGQGTLILRSNAVMNVASDLSLCFRTNGTAFINQPILAVRDSAVLNIGGSITYNQVGSWTPAAILLSGGTINLTGGNVSAPVLTGFGTIANAGTITVPNTFSVNSDQLVGTLTLGNNLIFPNPIPLTFNLGAGTTIGSGVNDHLNVANNISFNNNPITLTYGAPLVVGTYTLISYGGAQSGSVSWVNPTRSTISLVQGSGQVALAVASLTPETLTWRGTGTSANWGAAATSTGPAATNWNANTERFLALDHVLFDDTGVAPTVVLTNAVIPGSITVNNSVVNYTINQSGGRISGFTGITKNGTGSLTLGSGGINDFSGPVLINAGTIRVGSFNTTIIGTNNSSILNIASGATFDLNGNSVGSSPQYGRIVTIAGTGVGGVGAIVHGGAASSPTLATSGITLASDASVGTTAATTLTLSGLAAPYNDTLNLAGNTLTTTGPGEVRLFQLIITNNGSITVNSSSLGIRNCILDGAGTLNLGNKVLNLYNGFTAGYLAKPINVGNGGILVGTPTAAIIPLQSPISVSTALSFTNSQTILASGVISGNGSLIKYGPSNLTVAAANTYTGPTLVNAGTFGLTGAGSVNSPLIQIAPGAALDTTGKNGTFTLAPGQLLSMNGAVLGDLTMGVDSTFIGAGPINGSLTVNANSEVALGTTNVTGLLYVSNNVTLAGGHFTWETSPSFDISDGIVVGGNLTLTGTNVFTINSIGGFDPSGYNTLITYAGTFNGGLTNLALNTQARFAIEFVDPATTPGKIQIRLVTPSPLLTWKGGTVAAPLNWDVKTTANWDNSGTPDTFWQSDLVRFDDAANTNIVNLVGTLGPAAIAMENSAVSYIFGGSGTIVAASLTNNTGSLTLTNTGNNLFTGDGLILNGGNITFAQPVHASLTANLNGSGSFTKAGNSNLIITGTAANYTGTINVNAGQLRAGSTNAVAGTVAVASGGTLDVNGQYLPLASVITSGSGSDGFGALNNKGIGRTNALANVTLTANTVVGALSNAWGISGSFNGSGFGLTKTNVNDVWIQTGSDTALGDVVINQGRLVFGQNGTTLGMPEKEILVRSGATLALAATNQMPQTGLGIPGIEAGQKNVTLQSGGTFESVSFGVNRTTTNTFDGPITIATNGVFKVGQNSQLMLNGPISGLGQLTLTNNGTLMLNGTNSYSSNTFVYSGTLLLTNAAALPPNSILAVSNLSSSFGNASVVFGEKVEFPATNIMRISSLTGIASVGGDGTWNGPILMYGSNTFNISGGTTLLNLAGPLVTTNAGGTMAFHGSNTRVAGALIAPAAAVTIGVGDGLGQSFGVNFTTVTFEKSNFWTTTTIDRGRVNLGTNNALPVTSAIRVGTLASGVSDRRIIFDLGGYSQVISNLAEAAAGDSTVLIGNSSSTQDSLLIFTSAITNTWGVRIIDDLDSPITPHTTALTVTSGTLNLLATNTYTGPTLITGGRLNLNRGSGLTANWVGQLGNSIVTVSGSGTLGGSGLVQGPITIGSGGTLAPGNTLGTLTATADLTLLAGSKCVFEVNLNTQTNDQVVGINQLTYGGTLVITNVGTQAFTNGTVLQLFSAAAYTGGPVTIQPALPGTGLMWDTSSLAVNGTLKVVPSAPALSGTTFLPDGNIAFTLTGTSGQAYSVFASTNVALPLSNWTLLSSGNLPAATAVFTDLTATNYPMRFYRTSTP